MSNGIIILGATGPAGEMLARDLCAADHKVWVMMRSDERKKEFEDMGATVVIGDAMDRDAMFSATQQAADACDTVVNLIGGSPMNPPESWPDYTGNVNAIDAAVGAGIGRFIFVTSVGTGSSWQYVPAEAFTRPILELKTKAEEHLHESGLRYCIIKPGGLWHSEQVSAEDEPLVTENDSVRGILDRTQLVRIIGQVLADTKGRTDGKALYAVTYKINVFEGDATPFEF
ncbi:MAG: NAD(P)H-binding protein [Gammaproteobacteria bacterium]|nr:NAD(P)H-binding protein [Gammaproteobacteria bacterium]